MNPYCMFDLSDLGWTRLGPRRSFPVTRSGADVDLPGFGRGRTDMSDQEDTPAAQTARGGSSSRDGLALRDDDR